MDDIKRHYGIYRGVVQDNHDPQQQRRLRLSIPQITGSEVTDWAWPVDPASTSPNVPANGQGVWVAYIGGDPEYPIWLGTFGKNNDTNKKLYLKALSNATSLNNITHEIILVTKNDGTQELDVTATLIALAQKEYSLQTTIYSLQSTINAIIAGQGLQGGTGAQGAAGIQGATGIQGSLGLQGVMGVPGSNGAQGANGTQGTTGSQGTLGLQGVTGTQGATGTQGTQGLQGGIGAQGIQGAQGTTGIQGNQGLQGTTGAQGIQGVQGGQGLTGVQGLVGIQGIQGNNGAQGSQGVQGLQGLQGTQGLIGTQGVLGVQGAIGAQGIQGRTGAGGTIAYYGSFLSTQTQTASVINTGYPFTYDTTVENNGVRVVSGSQLQVLNQGTYNLQFSTQFHNTGGAGSGKDVLVWLRKNGVDVVESNTDVSVNTNSPYMVAAWNFVMTLAANDYLELVWSTSNTSIVVESSTPVVGPAIPSVIATVTQIAYSIQGLSGTQGIQGTIGLQGTTGLQGLTGTGTQGIQGVQGPGTAGGVSYPDIFLLMGG